MFLSLLSNAALAKRFLQYAALIPLVLRFIEHAEATNRDGATKRKIVLGAMKQTTEELVKSGFLPGEIKDEPLEKTVGELVDLAVKVYNRVGFFKTNSGEHVTTSDPAELIGTAGENDVP